MSLKRDWLAYAWLMIKLGKDYEVLTINHKQFFHCGYSRLIFIQLINLKTLNLTNYVYLKWKILEYMSIGNKYTHKHAKNFYRKRSDQTSKLIRHK